MDKQQALHSFWSRFGIAYDAYTVPDNAPFPRITYECSISDWGDTVFLTGSVWDRSTSWKSVTDICNQISEYIGLGGCTIPYDGGMMWITKGSPFAIRLSEEDDSVRRIVFNINVEFISAD